MSSRKLLSWEQVHELIPLSRTQITRLEDKKKWPERVVAGPFSNSRVFWWEDEVVEAIPKLLRRRSS